jgi:hypothetical protein
MFQCDGCGVTSESEEVIEAHILEQDIDDVASIVCWGVMVVGSEVWQNWLDGVHPMTMVTNQLSKTLMEYPDILFPILEEK